MDRRDMSNKTLAVRLLQALLWFASLSHIVIGGSIMLSPEFLCIRYGDRRTITTRYYSRPTPSLRLSVSAR
jgi:hypothetical protein